MSVLVTDPVTRTGPARDVRGVSASIVTASGVSSRPGRGPPDAGGAGGAGMAPGAATGPRPSPAASRRGRHEGRQQRRRAEHGDDSSRRGHPGPRRSCGRVADGAGLECASRARRPAPAAPAHRRPARRSPRSWTGSRRCIDELGRAVRRRRPRAGPGRRSGARRDARPATQRPRLHHLGAPRGRPSGCSRAGPTRSGTWAARSAPSAAARATWQVEITTYRSETYDPVLAQARRRLRRLPRRRPGPARLHRQRDGGARCPAASSRTRTAGWSTSRTGCCGRRAARRTPSPTTRCG